MGLNISTPLGYGTKRGKDANSQDEPGRTAGAAGWKRRGVRADCAQRCRGTRRPGALAGMDRALPLPGLRGALRGARSLPGLARRACGGVFAVFESGVADGGPGSLDRLERSGARTKPPARSAEQPLSDPAMGMHPEFGKRNSFPGSASNRAGMDDSLRGGAVAGGDAGRPISVWRRVLPGSKLDRSRNHDRARSHGSATPPSRSRAEAGVRLSAGGRRARAVAPGRMRAGDGCAGGFAGDRLSGGDSSHGSPSTG